jgi:hypothetical protein
MIVPFPNSSEIILRKDSPGAQRTIQMTKTVKKPNLTVTAIAPKKAGAFIRPGMHYRPE